MKKLSKFPSIDIVFYLILLVSVNASNPPVSEPNHIFVLNGIAVEMMTECYADVKSVVIHGDSDKSTIQSIQNTDSVDVILLRDSSTINGPFKPRPKINVFLMTPDSKIQLKEILMTFKSSPWWNIMTAFFIVDKSNRGCKNARNILKAAWKMNLVKSFFLCVKSNDVPMVYTYNPYTNRAPQPWKRISSSAIRSDGWTMYARPHRIGNICEGLNFDRTKHLDGSIIRIVTTLDKSHTWIPGKDYDESITAKMYEFDSKVVKALKYALNVTLIFNIDEPVFGVFDEPRGFYKWLQNGSSDIAICLRSPGVIYNFTPSYPFGYSAYHIATNNRGFYTPWEKIENYYGLVTLVSLCIILSMTFAVIVLSGKKRKWAFAAFEILRLLVNASLHSRMDTLARRIFFAVIFLYFLIIQATFQGHISAFLTKEQYRRNVEKLEDLRDPRYTQIYVTTPMASMITDPLLRKKLILRGPDCAQHIIGKDSAACITDIVYLLIPAFEHKLHVSEKPIHGSVYGYVIREDWPLKERFNIFLMRLEQNGLRDKWRDIIVQKTIDAQKRIAVMSQVHARPVSLSMLQFAFIIYGVGMTLATICFIFERRIPSQLYHFILNKWRSGRREHRNVAEVRQ